MGTQTQLNEASQEAQVPHWSLVKRLAFRFCFAYLGLFCFNRGIIIGSLLLLTRNISFPSLVTLWPMRRVSTSLRPAVMEFSEHFHLR